MTKLAKINQLIWSIQNDPSVLVPGKVIVEMNFFPKPQIIEHIYSTAFYTFTLISAVAGRWRGGEH